MGIVFDLGIYNEFLIFTVSFWVPRTLGELGKREVSYLSLKVKLHLNIFHFANFYSGIRFVSLLEVSSTLQISTYVVIELELTIHTRQKSQVDLVKRASICLIK